MASKGPHTDSIDALKFQVSAQKDPNKFFMSISDGEKKPFDFFRALYDGCIAGGVAGVAVETALYPIDTIKTRLQARARKEEGNNQFIICHTRGSRLCCRSQNAASHANILFPILVQLPCVARGGGKIILKGLYSGLAGNLVGVLPASAIFIGVYEPTKQKLLKSLPENLSAVAHVAAGVIGGTASSLIRVPTEVIKQRMQIGQFKSAPAAIRLIIANEGFKGLYAGYGSFLLRDLPFDAIELCIYEQLRIGYKLAAKRDLNDPENCMLGAVAGAITGAITTPLDVVKTRLMVQGSQKHYKGICDCVRTIVKEEGTHALFKGIGPRVLWIGVGGSIFFGVLEKTKQILAQRHARADAQK
ncbi:Mitochondrial carrier protein [Sesbania bispinosa]|nr:Mitochondrial carrier protein [Sesbania bispinosa]